MLHAEHISYRYAGGPQVLSEFSATFPDACLTALSGPSGVGKSTLLLCLAGVLVPEGSVFLDGEVIPSSSSARARIRLDKFGFIFQRGELLPELSVLDNVALPERLLGVKAAIANARALKWLQLLGIDDREKAYPSELSGGQAQRASVARALAKSPAIVLADEPTASLDDDTRAVVAAALVEAATAGACVIVASHDHRFQAEAGHRVALTGVRR